MAVDEISINETGDASVLRVWYFDAAGLVGNNTTGLYETWTDAHYSDYQVSGATEDGTSGRYRLTRPSWVVTPGSLEWHKVAGGTPSTDPQVGTASLEGESFTAQAGTTPPSTRRLYFRLKVGGIYTDPTGSTVALRDPTQTFGVKRQDTGAIVIGVSPLQTYVRESIGSYYFEIAETGLALLYGAEYTDPTTGAVVRQLLLSTFSQGVHYATTADLYSELGEANALIDANLSSSGVNEDSPAMIESSLAQADIRVDMRLGAYSPPPAAYPVTSTVAWVSDAIELAATKYAAGFLLNKRQRQSNTTVAQGAVSGGDVLIADGDAILQGVIDAGLLGVTLETEDETPAAGSFEFVTINRDVCTTTSDENARPLLWY